MRLRERDKKTLHLRAWGTVRDAYHEHVAAWGEPESIRAIVQPMNSSLDAGIYGEKVKRMKRVLYDGPAVLKMGDGLCVDVEGSQAPDYRIVAADFAERWILDIEYLNPAERGGGT